MTYKIKEIDGEPAIDFGAVSDGYVYIGKIPNCVFENNVYHVLYDTERGNVKYHDVLHISSDDIDEDTKKILDKIIKRQEEYHLHRITTEQDIYGPDESQRETPEQFKARTGKPWGDGNAVYMQTGKNDYFEIKSYREAKLLMEDCKNNKPPIAYIVYCANSDAGIPRDFYDTCEKE